MQNHQITTGIEDDVRTKKKQQLHDQRQHLVDEVTTLLSHNASEGLRWTGSRSDLLEALHIAYLYGRLIDEEGQLLTFRDIVERSCIILHLPILRNPWATVVRAKGRKGLRQTTFFERYCHQRHREPRREPIMSLVLSDK